MEQRSEESLHQHSADPSGANSELVHRRQRFAQTRSLSQYAVSLPSQPEDVGGIHPKDDRFGFFKKGRDFQPHKKQHHYTREELRVLETYENASILPSQTEVYRRWLEELPPKSDCDTWKTVCLISIIIGIVAFGMKEICERFQIFYNPFIANYVERGQIYRLWLYYMGLSCSFTALSAIICVYFCPWASGSGVAEIIGILNGAVVRNVLSFRTLSCKIISTILSTISGLPVGFEGPLVHIGAMIASFMAKPVNSSCCQSKVHAEDAENVGCCNSGRCMSVCRYRDCQERHNFICIGVASGVASAFSAPITGLLFAMEEMSSYWTNVLTWQTFVCCILARGVTETLRGFTTAIHHHITEQNATESRNFLSYFQLAESALFEVKEDVKLSIEILVPTFIIGILGGLTGGIFTFTHLKAARFRRRILAKINRTEILNLVKVMEPVVIAFVCSLIVIWSLLLFECKELNHGADINSQNQGKYAVFHAFQCKRDVKIEFLENKVVQTGMYHESATLLFGSWPQMIRNLFSRHTARYFSITNLSIIFGFFFVFSSWTSLTSVTSGLLIPQLVIGALIGRIIGRAGHHVFEDQIDKNPHDWEWMDPGIFALLGSAAFMVGTTRLPITSVVMLIEMTNDINMSLLIMFVVMLAKFIGDLITHPLYHSILEFKCIPYLESELRVYKKGKRVNLELYKASDVMASPVRFVNVRESVQVLANFLLDTNHGGFPVVQSGYGFKRTFLGIITRLEMTILLTKTESFDATELRRDDIDKIRISFPEYSSNKLKDTMAVNAILNSYSNDDRYKDVIVNLLPYINTSSCTVNLQFSLHRTHMKFRTLGLRHLVVVDNHNQVMGMITKKDLMGFVVDDKIKGLLRRTMRWVKGGEESTPNANNNQSPNKLQTFDEESEEIEKTKNI